MTPDRVPPKHPEPGGPASMDADLSLRCCLVAFAGADPASPGRPVGSWLDPAWRDRLEAKDTIVPVAEAEEALRALRRSHRRQARVDLGSVHPTWLERAAQDESPAVRRLLARPDLAATLDPEVASWVRTLATERLVGGEPSNESDPPVVVALGGLSRLGAVRMADAVGRAKLALALGDRQGTPSERAVREGWYLERLVPRLGGEEDKLRQWALRETQRAEQSATRPGRVRAFLGMTTLARLLGACEPFRIRWVLQRLPYPVAKRFRGIMSSPGQSHPLLLQIEEVILRTAWERLSLDARVVLPYPEPIARPGHVP